MPERRLPVSDALDEQLFELFGSEQGVPDGGFTERVMRSIRRRDRIHATVVAVAVAIGGVIAMTQIGGLLTSAAELLLGAAAELPASLPESRYASFLVGVAAALLAPVLVRAAVEA